ncbi:hypothetical protein [Marinobacterium sp. MBR-109]|jgi:hypothetical protein|uniref:hypothetical protein n=1 Tax=Marinobacterium sp. MBR-109 TaxID=3156462 RepID=UPI0033999C1F
MEQEEASAPDAGYIKLFRTLQDSAFSDRPEYFSAWVHILMLASHKPRKAMLANQPVMLQAGQFVSGRKALAKRVGVTEKQMRGILEFFEGEGMITKSSSRAGTVFTVCNYSFFQSNKGQEGPTVLGQGKGQANASSDGACSETGAKERASKGPSKRATTQEHNTIPNGIDIYASSGDESASKRPAPKKSPPDYPEEFEWIWQNRPRREGSDPKRKAFQACNARIKQGATWRELAEGMKRYNRFCEAKGILNTEFTKTMAVFFGPDEHFRNDWAVTTTAAKAMATGGKAKGPDWDDLDWANDLGVL